MRFKIISNAAGQYRCQIVAGNGKVVWWTENYKTENGARNAISLLWYGVAPIAEWPVDEVDEGEEAEKSLAPTTD